MRIYLTATSETYPLSRKPAFIGINKANVSGQCLFVGGRFSVPDSFEGSFHGIAQYNSNLEKWFDMESGLRYGEVLSIAIAELTCDECQENQSLDLCLNKSSLVFVGGSFLKAGKTVTVSGIVRWDSGTWKDMGGVPDGVVNALAYTDGWLFVGGNFSKIDGFDNTLYVENIAMWKDSHWFSVGPGYSTAGNVLTLLYIQGCMYFGGYFQKVCQRDQGTALTRAISCAVESDPSYYKNVSGLARICTQNQITNSTFPLFLPWDAIEAYPDNGGVIQVAALAQFLPPK